MVKYINDFNDISNVACLMFKEIDDWHERREAAFETSEKLFHLASCLGENQFVGFQTDFAEGIDSKVIVFTSSDSDIKAKDFKWIFAESAEVEVQLINGYNSLIDSSNKTYFLNYYPDDYENQSDDIYKSCRSVEMVYTTGTYFGEFLNRLKEAGVTIRVILGKDSGGEFRSGIIIYVKKTLTTILRTMLTLAFPNMRLAEINNKFMELDRACNPPKFFENNIAGIIHMLMCREMGVAYNDSNDNDREKNEGEFESPNEELNEIEYTPRNGVPAIAKIEDLGMSFRVTNCLKRAGIEMVDEIIAYTDEDFRNIKGLGKKGAEELKLRLSKIEMISVEAELDAPSYVDMLNNLIGLNDVKEKVRKIVAFAKMKKDMVSQGKKEIPIALNMSFVGNPGTAKTTVARIMAGILNEIGLPIDNQLIEVGRADLIARYEGQTADKVRNVFRKAKGRILFIDEAYSLLENHEGEFGDEAISTIVQEMENNRDDMIVIFAGYPDKIKGFLERNPGLNSRIPFHINFPDYTPDEMVSIAEVEAEKKGFEIANKGKQKLKSLCESAILYADTGNGRFSRNMVESAILEYAYRTYGEDNSSNKDYILIDDDFVMPSQFDNGMESIPIGFSTTS